MFWKADCGLQIRLWINRVFVRVDGRLRVAFPDAWGKKIKGILVTDGFQYMDMIQTRSVEGIPAAALHRFRYVGGGLNQFRQHRQFQTGFFPTLIEKHGDFFRGFGVKKRSDGLYEYPNVALMNSILDRAGSLMRFRESGAPERIPPLEFALFFAKDGLISVSSPGLNGGKNANYQCHDFFVHLPGYLLMPASILRATRARWSILVELLEDPELASDSGWVRHLNRLIEAEVVQLDRVSAGIGALCATFDSQAENVLRAFLLLQGRGDVSLRKHLRRGALNESRSAVANAILDRGAGLEDLEPGQVADLVQGILGSLKKTPC